ncbi:sensor histidine kinase [Fodinicurvata sediminis]|uniref:sensor histidine kinase n=1 Tax=Fodinicurvata sediminis TaxID=1121832 RepID=UPI0003B66C8C|nr:HAMP domain-containing sensor histidine kinase [Fodinicurvata sediminis]
MRPLTRIPRSLAAKFLLLLVIFISVPVIIYGQLKLADQERATLLLRSVQEQGWLVGRSLRPFLERFEGQDAMVLHETLSDLGVRGMRVRLLFRPEGEEGYDSFYYVATSQSQPAEQLEEELEQLVTPDILGKLEDTCRGQQPLSVRYRTPEGGEEFLTSITPVNAPKGCWAIITSHATSELLRSSLGRPYWQMPEVRVAAAIYLLMAIVVMAIFLGLWGSLRKFALLANQIRSHGAPSLSFSSLNRVPELSEVAREFDRMVNTLQKSAKDIRDAAEENAHALKAPIAVISQATEPLRRAIPPENTKGKRALEVVEQSVTRLDSLVGAARRMEETVAELLNPPRERIDLSALMQTLLSPYVEGAEGQVTVVKSSISDGMEVLGGAELLETVAENLIDNAISFSPENGTIRVHLYSENGKAVLTVEDEGPGVPPENLERIFERNYSHRPGANPSALPQASVKLPNFGIGLWVVRRNVEAIGGSVWARNRDEGGLCMRIELPLAA